MIITDTAILSAMAESIIEISRDTSDLFVVFNVKDQEELNKVNEDIYYRNHMDEIGSEFIQDPKEVMVNILGVKFKYVIKDSTETDIN